jgi:hypothetical protein
LPQTAAANILRRFNLKASRVRLNNPQPASPVSLALLFCIAEINSGPYITTYFKPLEISGYTDSFAHLKRINWLIVINSSKSQVIFLSYEKRQDQKT